MPKTGAFTSLLAGIKVLPCSKYSWSIGGEVTGLLGKTKHKGVLPAPASPVYKQEGMKCLKTRMWKMFVAGTWGL